MSKALTDSRGKPLLDGRSYKLIGGESVGGHRAIENTYIARLDGGDRRLSFFVDSPTEVTKQTIPATQDITAKLQILTPKQAGEFRERVAETTGFRTAQAPIYGVYGDSSG